MIKADLFSTIIRLRAAKDATNFGYLGRQVQAWFLREVRRHDISISDHLHDENVDPEVIKPLLRPYTISTIYKGQYPARELRAGEWCWVRITALTQPLSQFLIEAVLPDLLPIAEILPLEFVTDPWKHNTDEAIFTQEATYAELMHQAILSEEKRLSFDFLSPTAFKQNSALSDIEVDVPLPIPVMLFGSYLNHWTAFSGAQISDEYGEFIEECVVINEHKIRTERVQFSRKDSRDAATGFMGQVRFAILGDRSTSRFGANWEHYANLTRMLSRFSFYCGSGRKTTRGLGQTNPNTTPIYK